jgi:hypothetical protein
MTGSVGNGVDTLLTQAQGFHMTFLDSCSKLPDKDLVLAAAGGCQAF